MGNRSLMLSLSRQARSGKWMREWEPRARRERVKLTGGGAGEGQLIVQPASSLWAASVLALLPCRGRLGDC